MPRILPSVVHGLVAFSVLSASLSGGSAQDLIVTIAGGGPPDGVPALVANLDGPLAVVAGPDGTLLVSTQTSVFKVDTSGRLSRVAGNGTWGFSGDGGPATSASLDFPYAVAVDGSGNLFIADSENHRIRKVAASSGIITTVAGNGSNGYSGDGGPATSASLYGPTGVAVDAAGNLFIADASNGRIRKVEAVSGIITTVAGDGNFNAPVDGVPATATSLGVPAAVALDGSGDLFIADSFYQTLRKVAAGDGIITTVAGNGTPGFSGDGGPAISASLNDPWGVAVDASGNLFIGDYDNNRVRKVAAESGIITTIAGNGIRGYSGDGHTATKASMNSVLGVSVDASGNVFFADWNNNRIREVGAKNRHISTVAGNGTFGYGGDAGPATSASLAIPSGVAVDAAGNVFIADLNNARIRKVAAGSGIITTVAGNGTYGYGGDGIPATSASLLGPSGVAVDGSGNLFIADLGNYRIRKVAAESGIITTVAGNGTPGDRGDGGPAIAASLNLPYAVAVDGAGNLFIADYVNNRVRKVAAGSGIITTVAGNGTPGDSGDGGLATSASLHYPGGVAVDAQRNLFIADSFNNRIRMVAAGSGVITTVAGNGTGGYSGDGGPATSASLTFPHGLAVDGSGNLLIADSGNDRIRKVAADSGIITTVAGSGIRGFSGDGGPPTSASLAAPGGVTLDLSGNVFIADSGNGRIRRLVTTPVSAAAP